MKAEIKKKLLAPFPKEYVKPAPKGKFGDYVPHFRYVERLRDCLEEPYDWKVEAIYGNHNGEQRIVGAKGTITIEGLGTFEGVGDVEIYQLNNQSDGTNYKFAESDSFKRACMRFGLGVELWSGDVTEEEDMVEKAHNSNTEETPKKKQVTQESGISPSKEDDEEDLAAIILDMCMQDKLVATRVWDYCVKRMETKPGIPKIVTEYESSHKKTFIEEAAKHYKAIMKEAKEREGNSKLINDGLDVGLELEEIEDKVEEKEMDFDNDDWKAGREADPMTEAQEEFMEGLIKEAIDKSLDELGAQAKQYLNSGNTSKVTCSDWIKKLKKAIKNANG